MNIKDIQKYLQSDWEQVEALIINALGSDIDILNKVNNSILEHSGKKLRPLISILISRACSGGKLTEASLRFAAATELLHNATLLHDDVADDSSERRGVPTVRALMGPTVSVLVGDFWLVKALQLVLGPENQTASDRVLRLFSSTLASLAEGEMLQLQKAEAMDTTLQDYLRIIYCKTASLFETAGLSAAISVGASPQIEAAMGAYANALGVAFQIRDDILDYAGDPALVGKPLGVDITEGKITLPLIGALSIAPFPLENAEARRNEIIAFVRTHNGIPFAESRLQDYITKAIDALEALPNCYEKDCLIAIAKFVGERNY